MKKNKLTYGTKHILSLFLAICIMVTLMPFSAFADAANVFKINCDTRFGSVQYKINEGNWVAVTSDATDIPGLYGRERITVTVTPNENYEIDASQSGYVSFNTLSHFSSGDIAALTSADGYGMTNYTDCENALNIYFKPQTSSLDITCQSNAEHGAFYYKNAGDAAFTQAVYDTAASSYHSVAFNKNGDITVKLEPADGYRLDTVRGVTLRADIDGAQSTLFSKTGANCDAFTSDSGYTFNPYALLGQTSSANTTFNLEFGFENANGGSHQPGGSGNTTANITYTPTGEAANIEINSSYAPLSPDASSGDYTGEASFNADSSDTTVDISLSTLFIYSFKKIEINGVDYSNFIPKTQQELINAFKDQQTWVRLTVPRAYNTEGAENYRIVTETETNPSPAVGNFLWTTDPAKKYISNPDGTQSLNDDYIENGKIELVSLKYNGTVYSGDALMQLLSSGTAFDWDNLLNGSATDGGAVFPAGAEITVKLTPDFGYQLTDFTINGGNFTTGENLSEFTFEIKPGNFHLGAHFTPVDDSLKLGGGIKDIKPNLGGISLPPNTVTSGSLTLSVATAQNSDSSDFEKLIKQAGLDDYNYSVLSVFDINLSQIVYKGTSNADDAWVNEINNLTESARISLSLSDSYAGKSVILIHKTHDGSYEFILTDTSSDSFTFYTDSFSDYAVAVADTLYSRGHTHSASCVPVSTTHHQYVCHCGLAESGAHMFANGRCTDCGIEEAVYHDESEGQTYSQYDYDIDVYVYDSNNQKISFNGTYADLERWLNNHGHTINDCVFNGPSLIREEKRYTEPSGTVTTLSPNEYFISDDGKYLYTAISHRHYDLYRYYRTVITLSSSPNTSPALPEQTVIAKTNPQTGNLLITAAKPNAKQTAPVFGAVFAVILGFADAAVFFKKKNKFLKQLHQPV